MVTKTGLLILGAAVFVAASALTTASEAFFSGELGNPMGVCVNASFTGTLSPDWEGDMNSSTSETMTLDCSLPFRSTGAVLNTAGLWGIDRSSSEKVSCNLRVNNWWGATLFTGATQRTSASGTGAFHFSWSPTGVGTIGAYSYMSCSIPKAVGSSKSGLRLLGAFGS
jgi:hypothetical protein